MNNTLLALIALGEQLKDVAIQPDAKLTLVVSPDEHMPAVVIEQTAHGERVFVQSALRNRLCRVSYSRDGGTTS
jgi:hypothetical protein